MIQMSYQRKILKIDMQRKGDDVRYAVATNIIKKKLGIK